MEDSFTLGLADLNLDKAARVFRAAAKLHSERGNFYMSYEKLAECVGLSNAACHGIARKLVSLGFLIEIEKGSIGMKGKSTIWRWIGTLVDKSVGPTEERESWIYSTISLAAVHVDGDRRLRIRLVIAADDGQSALTFVALQSLERQPAKTVRGRNDSLLSNVETPDSGNSLNTGNVACKTDE